MTSPGLQARLILNGKNVGTVRIRGSSSSWGYGEFIANDNFADFAPLFGQWSLLMHADDDETKISQAASDELRQTECALDALKAHLEIPQHKQTLRIGQINIDGPLIEWKVMEIRSYAEQDKSQR